MPKRIIVDMKAQTSSQETFIVDPHQDTVSMIESLFTNYVSTPTVDPQPHEGEVKPAQNNEKPSG